MPEIIDPEELVVNLYDLNEIGFVSPPGPDVEVKDVDYPEEVFLKLKSGRMSPDYVNTRNVTGFSASLPVSVQRQKRTRDLVVGAFGEMLDEQEYDHHLGIPMAATCLSGMIAQARGDSVLWLRPESKKYGIHERIQGHYAPGERVVFNDNVITDGASKFEMIEPVNGVGLEVASFNVLVDREEGGKEALEAAGYSFRAFVGMQIVADLLLEARRITQEQHSWSVEYRRRVAAGQ